MRVRMLFGLVAEIPRKNARAFVDHAAPDLFAKDEEVERRAARSLASRHRSLFLPEKKVPRF